jgi:hypothetical protein
MPFDAPTVVASLIGGTAGGAGLSAGFAARRRRAVRKGRARMLHEDLMHLQSTIARTFYAGPGTWWEDAWIVIPATSEADRQDLYSILERNEYTAVASALGWMDYFMRGRDAGRDAPTDQELRTIYARLAAARYALRDCGDVEYRVHRPEQMRPADGRAHGEGELVAVTREVARQRCSEAAAEE